MARLKIQSAEDITAAYLSCLNIKKDAVPLLLKSYPELAKATDIPAEIDEIIYQKAKKIYKTKLPKIQMIALYKAVFLETNLAQQYGVYPLLPDFDDPHCHKLLLQAYIETAPSYKITDMPTQEITPISLQKKRNKHSGEKKC
ncbi:MAG: hypothetical protein Q4D80_03615 [Pseudomonadota bacterium]|nr:hypothetical protein [Pseudomonadota bacterium]